MTQLQQLYKPLMLLGCLPFVLGAAAPYLGVYDLPIIGNIQSAVAYYGLAIVSFMAGVQWGMCIVTDDNASLSTKSPLCRKRMMLYSNAFVLAPWLALATMQIGITYYFSLAVALMLILLTDHRLMVRGTITEQYYSMRLLVTAIVLPCLVSLAFTA